jgi:hypothetical protein
MKVKICLAIFAHWANMAFSQNGWIGAGIPITTLQINCLYKDSINDKLYACGQILNPTFSKQSILAYNGSSWDTLGNFNNHTRAIVSFNNEIIVAGHFTKVNDVIVNYIAKFNGINWQPFGNFNGLVWNLKHVNGELFAMGTFSMVDNLTCNGIAKWSGVSWQPVYNFPFIDALVYDAEIYQDDLYVGGNSFDIGSNSFRDIVVYKNGTWQTVGNGIAGIASVVDKLLVYKNELYVGGLIWRNAGNIGDGIQKWNGTSWSDLGMGLRAGTNPNTSQPHVYDIKVFNNELYVAGVFNYADSLPANSLAKWDGEKWCNFPTQDFINTNGVVDIYHDTIFTGCGYDTLNGDTINYLAKMLSNQPLGCRITGIEATENNKVLIPFPNPATQTLKLSGTSSNTLILITNLTGNIVLQTTLNTNQEIDIRQLSNGMYIIQAQLKNKTQIAKFIKQ